MIPIIPIVTVAADLSTKIIAGSALVTGIAIGAKCGRTLAAGAAGINAVANLLNAGAKLVAAGGVVGGVYSGYKAIKAYRKHKSQRKDTKQQQESQQGCQSE